MRFSDNGYYIERYIKCDNCGMLIYDDGIDIEVSGEKKLVCSSWCDKWLQAKAQGIEEPRIPLSKEGIHETA